METRGNIMGRTEAFVGGGGGDLFTFYVGIREHPHSTVFTNNSVAKHENPVVQCLPTAICEVKGASCDAAYVFRTMSARG